MTPLLYTQKKTIKYIKKLIKTWKWKRQNVHADENYLNIFISISKNYVDLKSIRDTRKLITLFIQKEVKMNCEQLNCRMMR